jgi:flagellar M-ring protein FliF
MNELLKTWWAKVSPWWNKYSKAQRRNIAIAAIGGLVCAIVVLWLLLRPHYVTILTGLDDKSLGQVDQKLTDLKIPHRIIGSSIEVPASDADEARVQIAMAGLPKSGYIGYGSISNSFGMTKDQFDIQVLDALQQSLNQTIESIDGIESAQVHIVMPEQQLFVSQPQYNAKASVFVQLGPGVQLSPAQVAGIQQLVAHSVKGLSPADVTVVDQNGVTLSNASNSGVAGGEVTDELRIRQQVEQNMQSLLAQGLTQIVGPGNAVVLVHADLSFDKVTSKSQIYQPAPGSTTGLPSSTQTYRKSTTTTGNAVGGVPGQATSNPNLPSYAGPGSGGGGTSTSTETSQSIKYDNSKTETTTVKDPMQIKGYTVSVLLNADDPNLTPAVVNQIRNFVATSVGQSAAAGANNNITVETVPFHKQSSSGLASNSWNPLLYGSLAGAALLGAGWYVLRQRKRKQLDDMAEVRPIAEPEPLVERPLSDEERMKQELARLAHQKPDEFVSLLRTWLASD